MKIRSIKSYIGYLKGYRGFTGYDCYFHYPSFQDIKNVIIGKYRNCSYRCKNGSYGHIMLLNFCGRFILFDSKIYKKINTTIRTIKIKRAIKTWTKIIQAEVDSFTLKYGGPPAETVSNSWILRGLRERLNDLRKKK